MVVGTNKLALILFLGVLFCLPICLPSTLALEQQPDHIIINSQDWQDVYSGMVFGNILGVPNNFLVSTRHATILLYSIPVDRENILVLSNRNRPFIAGYEQILLSRGYDSPFEIRSRVMNLDLAEELAIERPELNSYIVIDDAYGYNAISLAPYAVVSEQYVLFANEENIVDIVDFLDSRNPDSIIIYGQVDREVKDGLAPFNPTTINYGNRFDNNIEVVRRYLEINPTRQTILTNGEFIESGIMSGQDPVLFLGRENVPQQVRDFIQSSDIDVGILIGNELVNAATFVRRQLGISVFVKFAQGARQPTGAVAQVEDLDRFPMPRYDFLMEIVSIVYNRGTGALEVTYRNLANLPLFFRSTLTIRDGGEIKIASDDEPIFLDGNEYKTILYRYDIDGNLLNLQADDLSGDVFTVFGEGPQTLENQLQKSFSIDIIDVLDDAEINITDLYYDQGAGKFFVYVENVGQSDAYVKLELIDVVINGELVTIGADETELIPVGRGMWIPISVTLADEDILDNEDVRVRAYYGERELALIKILEADFAFRLGGGLSLGKIALYVLIIGVILLLIFFLGTKKKCPQCGHKNPRGRKTCEKCGYRF